jgi:predicted CXXCH cytochrome family protein
MRTLMLLLITVCLVAMTPGMVLAKGAHDGLTCTGCHALHTAKESELIFAVGANKKDVSPKTKQTYGGITALCLGCHDAPEKGGQGIIPIAGHMSHPYGLTSVNPKIARVPADLLREGRFECVSCHDPHPSNPNYKYLRVSTGANGGDMEGFCAVCHPMKADSQVAASRKAAFSSMDERAYSGAAAAAPAAAAPAAAKKPAAPAAAPAPAPKKAN